MKLTLRRAKEAGLSRYGSLYLLSAALVLAGGVLALRPRTEPFPWGSLRFVFATQVAYQTLLVAALTYLARVRKLQDEALLLLFLLSVFVFDGLFIQHRYGWAETLGREAAVTGALFGLLSLGAAAFAFGVPLRSRLLATAATSLLFVRFGPTVVDVLKSPGALVPDEARLHAYGALLALCLVPACLLRDPPHLDRAFAVGGVLLPLAIAVAHFGAVVGREPAESVPSLLAPFTILLGPAIWRLAPELQGVRAFRFLAHGLPVLGLFLAASTTIPTLLETPWARRFPLTPFWSALVLCSVLCALSARATGRRPLWHLAAAAAGLSVMAGDLPEILARIAFPSLWQAPLVALLVYGTLVLVPHPRSGLLLQVLPAALLDGFLTSLGLPRGIGYASGSAIGVLLVTRSTETSPARAVRAALWMLVTLPPAFALAVQPRSPARLALAAAACFGAALAGRRLREPLALLSAAGALVVTALGCAGNLQVSSGVSSGPLLIEAGFLVLVLAFLDTFRRGAALRFVSRSFGPAPPPLEAREE